VESLRRLFGFQSLLTRVEMAFGKIMKVKLLVMVKKEIDLVLLVMDLGQRLPLSAFAIYLTQILS
jgi:hypothetical protein